MPGGASQLQLSDDVSQGAPSGAEPSIETSHSSEGHWDHVARVRSLKAMHVVRMNDERMLLIWLLVLWLLVIRLLMAHPRFMTRKENGMSLRIHLWLTMKVHHVCRFRMHAGEREVSVAADIN
jgi:hypothetical protein